MWCRGSPEVDDAHALGWNLGKHIGTYSRIVPSQVVVVLGLGLPEETVIRMFPSSLSLRAIWMSLAT
jgi:hypothetical protein